MKVIFLDVDGVLNSDDFIMNKNRKSDIDEENVKLLKRAVIETGAKVVVDSSFRYKRRPEILITASNATAKAWNITNLVTIELILELAVAEAFSLWMTTNKIKITAIEK